MNKKRICDEEKITSRLQKEETKKRDEKGKHETLTREYKLKIHEEEEKKISQ